MTAHGRSFIALLPKPTPNQTLAGPVRVIVACEEVVESARLTLTRLSDTPSTSLAVAHCAAEEVGALKYA